MGDRGVQPSCLIDGRLASWQAGWATEATPRPSASLFVWIVGVPARQTPVKLVRPELDTVNNAGCMAFRDTAAANLFALERESSQVDFIFDCLFFCFF